MDYMDITRMDEGEARAYLERIRWPNGPACVHCGDTDVIRLPRKGKVRAGVLKCRGCRRQFTATCNTVMHSSHIPIRSWLAAISLMCASKKGISSLQLQRMLGLASYKSAWHLSHRIRKAMEAGPLSTLLGGVVEADTCYVGGKPRPHAPEVKQRKDRKTEVMALVERGGNIRAFPMWERVTYKTLRDAVVKNVHPSATLMTDEASSFHGLGKHYAGGHHTTDHSKQEYARPGKDGGPSVHSNTAESFFALLKRGVYGSFHQISRHHTHRYVDEFSFRWRYRNVSDGERTDAALRGAEGKRLPYHQPAA
jgi:transposase-like protein